MEKAKKIIIPVTADEVLSPQVFYGEEILDGIKCTGIYFVTNDTQYGRISFDKLDSLKVSRGEYLPYEDDVDISSEEPYPWVFKVEKSNWLKQRFDYENSNYGKRYEFGRNVNEMLTDFNHYIFRFHDEFIEVIARGFWYEKNIDSLLDKELPLGHPLVDLSEDNMDKFVTNCITCQVRKNPKTNEEIIKDAKLCPQKIMQFALEFDDKATVSMTLTALYRKDKLISVLNPIFGDEIMQFDGFASFDEVKPYIDEYMKEVCARRKKSGKV